MADYSYLALIEGLNSDSPAVSTGSPDDFTDLALWTNAEFTFELDSTPFLDSSALLDSQPQEQKQLPEQQQQQYGFGLDFMNLTAQQQQQQSQSRPMSLLERTRQGNPVAGQAQYKPALQDQIMAANAYQTLLASHSDAAMQQEQVTSFATDLTAITPTSTMLSTAIAPTTPAAAKLLRQDLPQYKVPSVSVGKEDYAQPASPTSTQEDGKDVLNSNENTTENDKDPQDGYELSAADSFSRDDPAYLSKVAAEEDKRRRNTAASARFRQKKRLREQALEQNARDQTARAEGLENRIRELEMEVRWLRGWIVEKDSRLQEATTSLREHQVQINLMSANSSSSSINGVEEANKRIRMDAF